MLWDAVRKDGETNYAWYYDGVRILKNFIRKGLEGIEECKMEENVIRFEVLKQHAGLCRSTEESLEKRQKG